MMNAGLSAVPKRRPPNKDDEDECICVGAVLADFHGAGVAEVGVKSEDAEVVGGLELAFRQHNQSGVFLSTHVACESSSPVLRLL